MDHAFSLGQSVVRAMACCTRRSAVMLDSKKRIEHLENSTACHKNALSH